MPKQHKSSSLTLLVQFSGLSQLHSNETNEAGSVLSLDSNFEEDLSDEVNELRHTKTYLPALVVVIPKVGCVHPFVGMTPTWKYNL